MPALGGLGLRDMSLWNKSLVMRLKWNICMKKDTLWVKWIHTIMLKKQSLWGGKNISQLNAPGPGGKY